MYNTIKFKNEGGKAEICLNRPEVYNAFNEELSGELKDALKAVKKDKSARVLIISGEGKAFCSGQDLKDISKSENRSLSDSLYRRYNPIIKAIRKLEIPVICRLNGVAAGAGCSLALACDLIIASEKASLIEVFINVGLVLDSGSSYFLPRLVGPQKAFELATQGTKVSAEKAEKLGMVNKVVPPETLDEEVNNAADYYSSAPTKAIGMIKKMMNKTYRSTLEEMLQYEAYCQEIAGRSEDYKEGVQAFIEKRKPNFKGK